MCDYCYWEDALDLAEEILECAEESVENEDRVIKIKNKAEALYETIEEKEHVTNEQRNLLEIIRDRLEELID